MVFLDLPIELFRPIVEAVVLRCDRCSSRKHRDRWDNHDIISLARVNTIFEWEVFRVLEAHCFFTSNDSLPSLSFLSHPDSRTFLARFIATCPFPSTALWNAHFPALVNAVVDKLIQVERPTRDAQKLRDAYLKLLCHGACSIGLINRKLYPTPCHPFQDHLLVAAIHLNKGSLVDELIYPRTNLLSTFSELWRYPLNVAITNEDLSLIRRLLERGATWMVSSYPEKGWSCLEDAVRATKSLEIISLLFEKQRLSMSGCTYELGNAIKLAIHLGKEDVAIWLLDTQCMLPASKYGGFWSSLSASLIEACKGGMCRLIPRLLQIGAHDDNCRWSGATLRDLVFTACENGHEAILKMLLGSNTIVRYLIPHQDFFLQAAIAGHVGITRVLLDAGATLSPIQAMELLKESAPRPPCAEAIWYLLHRNAIVVDDLYAVEVMMGYRVAYLMTTAAQRGNIEFLEALGRYGVPLDDDLFYKAVDCPLPIVSAKAFRQLKTVEALKELGVADADPMQSTIGRHFRSGKYPCDPPPLEIAC